MAKITPKSILKQNRKEKKITEKNLEQKASSDNVSDAMKNIFNISGVIEGIKPIDNSFKVVGRIRTAQTDSNDWGTLIKAIYECKEDEILFVKCSDDKKAVWGEMASTAALKNKLKATVIFGASRDTNEIKDLGYKVFSKTTRSNAGLPSYEGTIGEDIIIDDRIIKTGDLLIGDSDGVVIVSQDDVDAILKEVNNIKKFEDKCIKKLVDEDLNLDDILGI
ncbi:RraA family protein [Methanosphaera cuniculi]|uniref:RraA family protein n=1 Tax=Methanosphaera cuniculi TaxID=1077256 RepID=UPI0026DB1B1A|nr:RraA family protein [Methanosphaera cuniculi]